MSRSSCKDGSYLVGLRLEYGMFATLKVSYRLLTRMKDRFHAHCDCTLFLRGSLSRLESLANRLDTSTKLFCRETRLRCHLLDRSILSTNMDPVYIAAIAVLVLIVVWAMSILIFVFKTEIQASRYHVLD